MNQPSQGDISSSFYSSFEKDAQRFQFAAQAAKLGVWEMDPETQEMTCDDHCLELFGLGKDHPLSYGQILSVIHQEDRDMLVSALQNALNGKGDGEYDVRYRTVKTGDNCLRWVHCRGQAYFDSSGKPTRFAGVALDITEYAQAVQSSEATLQQSEARFRAVISSAPAAIGVFLGPSLVIDICNQVFINIVGKGQDIVGKPLREVMPELEDQPFLQILNDVYTSGKVFRTHDAPVNIIQNGVMTTNFYDVTFTPLFDREGKVYAILDISIDVTEGSKARRKLEEAQNILRDALELAELATWTIDTKSGTVEYSERLKSWLGLAESSRHLEKAITALPATERDNLKNALESAMNREGKGVFDMEYNIVNQNTGRKRIIHSQGRTFFDEEGKAVKIVGIAQDVSQQRNMQLALEQEVQQRTEEIDAANEELKATNEELLVINDELAALNKKLEQSNESLQQFAHVASHDLKEPIRKIKTFLGIIEADPANTLTANTKLLLQRVHVATERMFSMINGVLNYSSMNATGYSAGKIDLRSVVNQIVSDLELLIRQKNAIVKCHDLPVIDGVEILIYQLFSNLIINSLKFCRSDTPPVITLSATFINQNNVRLVRIIVADNGLGFDPRHSQQIFSLFTRLNSKDKYEGTGLGLSLCKKIVERHGGTIEASGSPDKGAIFTITLPLVQAQHYLSANH